MSKLIFINLPVTDLSTPRPSTKRLAPSTSLLSLDGRIWESR